MVRRNRLFSGLAIVCWPLVAGAQTAPDLAGILERLDRVERENRALAEQVKTLETKLEALGTAPGAAAAAQPRQPSADDRLEIQQARIDELAQTKVEAAQKFPIRLTGMALFNAFMNSKQNGGAEYPAVAVAPGAAFSGATLRQTTIGLEYRGPTTLWGGAVHGSFYMDFFAGAANSAMRMRTGSIEIDWKDRSVMVGVEKPIFNPREPSSLAQVGVSPLTGAGNLWLWLPQARVEQDLHFDSSTGLRARLGVIQTREVGPYPGTGFTPPVEAARPGLEGRFEFFHNLDDERRLEIAPGFHTSTTHAGGWSIPSHIFSVDWLFNPWRRLEFTGAFYTGQNVTPLGAGYQQGYGMYATGPEAVHSLGGWGQFTIHAARRVDLHLFTGQQDDNNEDLIAGRIGKNLLIGGNLYYRLAPNVLLGLESSQLRTTYLGQGIRINNHYDLALGYFF